MIFRLPSTVSRHLSAERDRLPLWLPVFLMLGIGVYFALPNEPPLWIGAALPAAAVLLTAFRKSPLLWLIAPLFMMALGFAAAELRTWRVHGPLLMHEMHYAEVEGTIDEIIVTEKGAKLVLSHPDIEGVAPPETPERIRVSFRKADDAWQIGDRVRLSADLFPLPPPVMPGGYDFARHFYYQRIGGNGFAFHPPEIVAHAKPHGFAGRLMRLRHAIGADMRAGMPGAAGAIAAAMTVGQTQAIPEDAKNALRDAGLAHMLAIAGLHLGLVTGFVFFSVRLLLSLAPPLALRVPVKKIAAASALAFAFVYLLLSGAPVSAERAFVMAAFVMLAIMFDRRGVSLRSLAFAAVIVLLVYPEAMLGPSFQLSFAATLAIINFYEYFGHFYARDGAWRKRLFYYFLGIAATSLAATASTVPFTLYQFNRFATFAMVGNIAAIPIATFVIMPSIVFSLLLMPLGLQWIAYIPLQFGIETMLSTAEWTVRLPMSAVLLPAPPAWGMLLSAFGLLWLCLMRTRMRFLGAAAMALGLATVALVQPPDVLIAHDGRQVMARLSDGRYTLLKGSSRAFAAQAWLRAEGQGEAVPLKEAQDTDLACGGGVCSLKRNGRIFRWAAFPEAVADACAPGADVAAAWWRVGACPGAKAVIDRASLERFGAEAVYLTRDGVVVKRAHESENRPWMAAQATAEEP